jgi:acyl dehydratase
MTTLLHYEELRVGDRWVSQGRTVTEADVVNFAGMTGDYNPLHVDHEFASETPFRRPIAHGLLGLSFVAGLSSYAPYVKTLAFLKIDSWEFLKPIFIGDTVHVETEVLAARPKGRRAGHVSWNRQLINQAGDVLQAGRFETLVSVADPRAVRRESSTPTTRMPQLRKAG